MLFGALPQMERQHKLLPIVHSILNSVSNRWFLVAVVRGFGVVWFWPGAMAWTTAVQPRLVIPLALFLIAWTMDRQRLFGAVQKPGPALLAVAIGFTLPPLVA